LSRRQITYKSSVAYNSN